MGQDVHAIPMSCWGQNETPYLSCPRAKIVNNTRFWSGFFSLIFAVFLPVMYLVSQLNTILTAVSLLKSWFCTDGPRLYWKFLSRSVSSSFSSLPTVRKFHTSFYATTRFEWVSYLGKSSGKCYPRMSRRPTFFRASCVTCWVAHSNVSGTYSDLFCICWGIRVKF
jgi:hypothetical protein